MNFANSLNAFQDSAMKAAVHADRIDANADWFAEQAEHARAMAAELRGEALAADPREDDSCLDESP